MTNFTKRITKYVNVLPTPQPYSRYLRGFKNIFINKCSCEICILRINHKNKQYKPFNVNLMSSWALIIESDIIRDINVT